MAQKALSLFDFAPGKVLLDRYKIEKTLRTGGMSSTFAAQDVDEGSAREVQVFPGALFESTKQAREFGKAMQKWLEIESPAVLQARDVHVYDDGSILFVTDLPSGPSLREWHKSGTELAPELVIKIGLQLLAGLAAIHAGGLVHGDVKPHTIHVDESKKLRVVLVDGGITPALWTAKHLGDKTALIGTPFYAPVEQFGGESPDVQSDIYNLATVLYELAAGVIPWKGKSFLEVFQSKLEKRPPPMSARAPKAKVSPELEAAIALGLMADKQERYASAHDFEERLKGLK
jgi:eukaryotic-like serine/threonine-protein kinase